MIKVKQSKKLFFAIAASFLLLSQLLLHNAAHAETVNVSTQTAPNAFSKQVLESLKPVLFNKIFYTDEELKRFKPEFQEFYQQDVLPKAESLYYKIRVIPIDIKDTPSQRQAILMGDTAREYDWGPKQFMALATDEQGVWRLNLFKPLGPTDTGSIYCTGSVSKGDKHCEYAYLRIKLDPKTDNSFIGAVISYASYGGSGSSYYVWTVGWNRYTGKYYMDELSASVPLIPDNSWIGWGSQP